ncbi:unnamed protein product [Moneuplotes crassus]|uniref:Uncharacterized protein n=1 Tax=Euplotes crassus TaxID=5936 RepID=A0AAD1TZJ9_EUPCR|nr:unnamed protein product [Moneuplotes crassus]
MTHKGNYKIKNPRKMETQFEPTERPAYSESLLSKLSDLGFDGWDIKGDDIEYIFNSKKFRVLHDFLLKYLSHSNVLTDSELICFKDIASIMVDKAKSDTLIMKMRKDDKSEFSDEIFTFDSFSDDDNLLALDDIEPSASPASKGTAPQDLDIIDEEFDNYEEILKQVDQYDLETLQGKMEIELERNEIEQKLGIDTEDTLKQQLISMEAEANLLDNEERLLQLELQALEEEADRYEAIFENKENQCQNNQNQSRSHQDEEELDAEVEYFISDAKQIFESIGTKISISSYSLCPHNWPGSQFPGCDPVENKCSISSSSVNDFTSYIGEFISKLNTSYETALHLLKNQNKSSSPLVSDEEMKPLIDNCFGIEKHLVMAQIREQRSKISLNCIQKDNIVTEHDATEEKVKAMEKSTQKLFEALIKELNKNSILRVNKLYKADAVSGSQEVLNSSKSSDNSVNLKQSMRLCELTSEKLRRYVYLTSALIELDKIYTQNLADSLVMFNEKSQNVKASLEELVTTLRILYDGKVSNIVSKDRKTIDGRDTFMNTIYRIAQCYMNNYDACPQDISTDKYLAKKMAIGKISSAVTHICKKANMSREGTDVDKKITQSENLQRVSKDICCWILKNNLSSNTHFSYLKPEIFAKIDLCKSKISAIDSEIHTVREDAANILKENSMKSLYGIEIHRYEILHDFLFNNSKRIINVIENPKIEEDLSQYLNEDDSQPGLGPRSVIIEPDNSLYQY